MDDDIITKLISVSIIIKNAALISKYCIHDRPISISHGKIGRKTWYFEL